MTIGAFAYLIDEAITKNPGVQNGSVTVVEYENGKFYHSNIRETCLIAKWVLRYWKNKNNYKKQECKKSWCLQIVTFILLPDFLSSLKNDFLQKMI